MLCIVYKKDLCSCTSYTAARKKAGRDGGGSGGHKLSVKGQLADKEMNPKASGDTVMDENPAYQSMDTTMHIYA